MKAKKYLSQLSGIDAKIMQKEEEAESIRSTLEAQGLRYDKERVSSSPRNTQEESICKLVDVENAIQKDIVQFVQKRDKIINQIQQLDDSRYVQILYLHYVPIQHKTMRLEEIACKLKKNNGDSYSYDHISRLHGIALCNFEKKFQNNMEMPNN